MGKVILEGKSRNLGQRGLRYDFSRTKIWTVLLMLQLNIWWLDLYLVNRIVDVVRTDGWHGYWTMAHSASGHLPNYQTAESFKSSAHTLRCTIRAKLFPDTTIKLAHCLVIARTFKPIMLKRKTSARQDMRCGDNKASHATINSLTILSQTLLVRTKARIFSY